MTEYTNIPWVEKYRPDKFENIVLDKNNRVLLENVLKNKYFPNMLFYGPPGTGKTTTITNLINKYHQKYLFNDQLVINSERVELKKVIWSTKAEVIQTTIIVFIVVIIMSVLLWLLDKLLGAGIKFLLA